MSTNDWIASYDDYLYERYRDDREIARLDALLDEEAASGRNWVRHRRPGGTWAWVLLEDIPVPGPEQIALFDL